MTKKWSLLFVMFACAAAVLCALYPATAVEKISPNDTITDPPPVTQGFFPCSNCHANMPVNQKERKLGFHTEITLKHMTEGWCFNCHNPSKRDKLQFITTGKLIDFKNAADICIQCHSRVVGEWIAGGHGKRTGMWNGKKTYDNCIGCHNPHQPAFQAIQPQLPPVRPEEIKLKVTK